MRAHKQETVTARKTVQTVAIGVGVGILVTAVLLLIAALWMTWVDTPASAVSPLGIVALGLGCGVAGFIAARRSHKNGWLIGAACGVLMFLVTWIAGMLSLGSVQSGFAVFKLAVTVLCGAIGGVLGIGR